MGAAARGLIDRYGIAGTLTTIAAGAEDDRHGDDAESPTTVDIVAILDPSPVRHHENEAGVDRNADAVLHVHEEVVTAAVKDPAVEPASVALDGRTYTVVGYGPPELGTRRLFVRLESR